MNLSQMITSLAMVQLCIRTGDLQLAHDECNRLIAICEAAQQGVQSDKCPACDGKGWFGAQFCEGEECPTCEGTGICR